MINILNAMGKLLIVASALPLALMVSCEREEPQERKIQAVNPYSTDSVFAETKKKLQENPRDADAWYHLADLYDRNSQYEEAIKAYQKAVELKPDNGYAYFKIGTAYGSLNRPGEAVGALKKATKLLPGYAPAYNNLGVEYGKLGKTGEEISALKKAIRLRPRYASARYNLGIVYLKTGNKKAAQEQYKALMDIDSGTAEALLKEIGSGSRPER
ncbi:MAG: tetratricopeptide repeat protein [Nitrospirales bacterium]|nr:tetratricopeptide repeat protein [Nitrospirales bacterium]